MPDACRYNQEMADYFTGVYNWLPLGHVIHKKVMVNHGGLFSQDGVTLDDIRAVDRVQQPPDGGIMCDMLWSDPQPQMVGAAVPAWQPCCPWDREYDTVRHRVRTSRVREQ